MTNANEMAQKGFDTGFIDANDNELHVGDYVRICGHIGKIVFSCGACTAQERNLRDSYQRLRKAGRHSAICLQASQPHQTG